ncbi:MAG: hypothetical protein ACLP7Q_08055 [Isosphaeraceae bacterium]
MDTITLVDSLIDDGRRLIDRLGQENIPLIMACWVKPVEEDRWSLYIGTSLLDQKGAARAYREVYRVLRTLGNSWVTDSDIRLVGEGDPITKEVLGIKKRYPVRLPTRSRRPQLGNLAVEETYVYPVTEHEKKPPRLSFTIDYAKKGETNEWKAKTKRGEEVIRGAEAKGAVGYLTAYSGGETLADVRHAVVLVLLEIDAKFERSDIEDDPDLMRALMKQANLMADELFKKHHPDAVIMRDEDEGGRYSRL